jgi:uncharacterized protein YbjT (DUF2867 family)
MILVTGATAPVGRATVEQLAAAGVAVRALTRNPATAGLPAGVETVAGDLAAAETLPAALAGVERVFLFPAVPGFAPGFAAAAKEAGVRRIVFQSSGAVVDGVAEQANPMGAYFAGIEGAIVAAGFEWTFLRLEVASSGSLLWAMELAEQIKAGDVVRAPYAEATASPIHESDFAAVAVAALTGDGHTGATYRVTGPESLTHAEQVSQIGEAIGRALRYEELTPEQAREAMLRNQPPPVVDILLAEWAGLVDRPAPVTDTIARLTGRSGLPFRRWAGDHAADFR